ncbi:ACP S-malonyltransferase [Lacticaseibacillus absianus]|uniref:ACP S-malonyltransferase n=1 Tax=Lacticaseibacillus absianus TaxID=2729623 RepID=UPI0015C802A6|nr:acyltransferase domain-containing protein [Lacticaseibacillus absianus]
MTTAYLFPGQGSETPGMGCDRFDESLIFKENILACDAVLPFDLPAFLFGSAPLTDHPDWLQPALVAYAVAAYRDAVAHGPQPAWLVGLSLGEYAALIASGALSLADGMHLVSVRGTAMAAASRQTPGGMLAVRDATPAMLAALTAWPDVWVANRNSPRQTVLGGTLDGLTRVQAQLKAMGARGLRLPTTGAFHTPLMAPAAPALAAALAATALDAPHPPVMSTTALAPFTAGTMATTLVDQISHPTDLAGAVTRLVQAGVTTVVELSERPLLSRLAQATEPALTVQNWKET